MVVSFQLRVGILRAWLHLTTFFAAVASESRWRHLGSNYKPHQAMGTAPLLHLMPTPRLRVAYLQSHDDAVGCYDAVLVVLVLVVLHM